MYPCTLTGVNRLTLSLCPVCYIESSHHTEADCVCVRVCVTGASLRGAHRRKQSRPGEQPARGGKPPPPPVHQGAPLMVTHAQQNQHLQCVASMLVRMFCPVTDKKRVTFLDRPQHWCVSHQEGVKSSGDFPPLLPTASSFGESVCLQKSVSSSWCVLLWMHVRVLSQTDCVV